MPSCAVTVRRLIGSKIMKADESRKTTGWQFNVSKDFVLGTSLTVGAKMVYLVLKAHCAPNENIAYPSTEYMARCLGVGRDTIQKYVSELRLRGWITTRQHGAVGRFTHTIYTVHQHPTERLETAEVLPVFPTGRMSKAKYRDYLATDHWATLRTQALERDGGKCRRCASLVRLHVHHKIYRDSPQLTVLEDLETLCEACHAGEHGKKPKTWRSR